MKILALKPNPSFLQEDCEWFEWDIKRCQEMIDKLKFPFEAKQSIDKRGNLELDDEGFPIIVDPNGNTWSSDHFIVEM